MRLKCSRVAQEGPETEVHMHTCDRPKGPGDKVMLKGRCSGRLKKNGRHLHQQRGK